MLLCYLAGVVLFFALYQLFMLLFAVGGWERTNLLEGLILSPLSWVGIALVLAFTLLLLILHLYDLLRRDREEPE